MKTIQYSKIIISFVLIIQGLAIILLPSKLHWFLGLLIFSSGIYFFYLSISNIVIEDKIMDSLVLSFLIKYFGQKTKFVLYSLGFSIVLLDTLVNRYYLNGYIGNIDVLLLLCSILLILYPHINYRYIQQYDFAFLFISFTTLLLILPRLLIIFQGELLLSEPLVFYDKLVSLLLTKPMSNILNYLGYSSVAIGNTLHFKSHNGEILRVSIDFMCSGIFSVVVFISAFVAFMLVQYRKFDSLFFLFLFLGVLTSYIANLIRMILIILAGHYWGLEALDFAHRNLGWIIFVLWIFLFWTLLFKVFDLNKDFEPEPQS